MVVTREPLPTRVEATPELPAEYGLALDAGLAALGARPSEPARTSIDGHVRLLLAWTDAINLTAIRDPEAVAIAHVTDSLSGGRAAPRAWRRPVHRSWFGWRFPGAPGRGGATRRSRPADRAGREEGPLPDDDDRGDGSVSIAEAAAVRAEALAGDGRHRGQWPAVIARAVANLADLVELALPLLEPRRDPRRVEAGRPGDRARCRGPGARRARWRHDRDPCPSLSPA